MSIDPQPLIAEQVDDTVDLAEVPGLFARFWNRYMGEGSPYRGLILVVLTFLVLINLKRYLTRLMQRKLREQAFVEENDDIDLA